MALREDFERFGMWLFRWRSYLPLLTAGLVLIGLRHFSYPGGSHRLDRIWELICLALSCVGIGVRVATVGCAPKGTSGRNVKMQVADALSTTGLYSIVRHPLYLGNFLIGLGISLFLRLWWFSLGYMVLFWWYYERIMFAEEEFLRRKFGQDYLAWAQRTPAFFPNVACWRPPNLPFSTRWAVKREYASAFAVIATYTVLELVGDFFAKGHLVWDGVWVALFAISAVAYGVVRLISKKTQLLNVQGR